MARFIGENKGISSLGGDIATLTRWGALAPFGQGAFRWISESTTFIVPPKVNNIRVRACGAGGGIKVATTHYGITYTRYDGGTTAFGAALTAGGGKAAVGLVGGLGGTTATGDIKSAGGAGGTIFHEGDVIGNKGCLGGGGASGSQLGTGGNGAPGTLIAQVSTILPAGGGCGLAHASTVYAGHPLIQNDQRLVGSGVLSTENEFLPRFIGDHFAEIWSPPYSASNGDPYPYGKCLNLSHGIGGFQGTYAAAGNSPFGGRAVTFDAGAIPVNPLMGGARGLGGILVDAGNNSLPTYNDPIVTNRAKAGGGGPSCGGGAWCMVELAVSPGDSFACTVGKANSTGGGGDGYIVVEW